MIRNLFFVLFLGSFVAVPTATSATPKPPEDASVTPAKTKHTHRESGEFSGALQSVDGAKVDVVMASGFVVSAQVTLKSGRVIKLKPSGTPNSETLILVARDGTDYLRLRGRFVLVGRAEGSFQGALNRKQVKGTWHILRT